MPNGVRLKPDAMVGMNDSALIMGSWMIDWPAGYRNAARTVKPWKIAPPRLTVSRVPPWTWNRIRSWTPSTVTFDDQAKRPMRVHWSSNTIWSRGEICGAVEVVTVLAADRRASL